MTENNLPRSALVVGGAGYIGSHTAKLLKKHSVVPVVLDNLCTGNRHAARFGPFYEGAIADPDLVQRAVRDHDIPCAILFAGHAYVGESTHSPRKYFHNNVADALQFLDTIMDAGVRSLVFSSSCSVYGIQQNALLNETCATNPLSPYAETKLFFERVLHWYAAAYGLQYVVLRYFNAAGADPEGQLGEDHDPETHLIPLAIRSAMNGTPLQVFGTDYPTPDGTAVRDYTHVADLGEAHVSALRYLQGGGSSVTLNLGTGTGHSVREVLKAVERESGRPVAVECKARRHGDAPSLIADASRARDVLGWTPVYSSLEVMVRTAWNWHNREFAAAQAQERFFPLSTVVRTIADAAR